MSTTLEMPEVAQKSYRLSPQQARLWLLQQESCAQSVISLEGFLRPEYLRAALRRVVWQHEILRTEFQNVPGMKVPVQVVTDDGEPAWRKFELWDLDEATQQAAIEELCRDEVALTRNPQNGTRMRALLAEVSPQLHLLVLTLPALCCDTLSLNNLMRHLADAYANSESNGETTQYVQFSEWQNELLEDDESAGRPFWKEHGEATAAEALTLPLEGDDTGTEHARRIERRLSETDLAAIDKVAGEKGTTAAVVLLACWQILLSRLSGRSQFPLRLSCGGRVYEEMQDAIGLYARWPRIECNVEEDFSFSRVIDDAARTVAHTTEWQEFYFDEADSSAQEIGFEYTEWPKCEKSMG